MNVFDIYRYIDSFAPFHTQDDFDNSGLLVGDGTEEVTAAAVCLDITNDVIEEVREKGAQVIVSHHPVIFHKPASIGSASPVWRLIRYGIAAVCVHTPLDMAADGISDQMYRLMGFGDPSKAEVLHLIRRNEGIGYGKIAVLKAPVSARELAEQAKKAFDCSCVRYTDGGRPIRRAAVCSGAGNDEIYTCMEKGADALITGDVKWHGFVDAKNAGLTVIDAGHYHTEKIACAPLARKLAARFPEARFFVPDASADVCRYLC